MQFTNSCGTFANIKVIITALVLIENKYLTGEEINNGLTAYALICRETKADYLQLTFDKVQRALRVSKINILFS